MATATLTSKGQITIPAVVRHDLKVEAGDRVEFIQVAPGRYEFVAANQNVTALKGIFGMPTNGLRIASKQNAKRTRLRLRRSLWRAVTRCHP
jgi:antitoxin PrlF